MKIKRELLERLHNKIPDHPPEIGGIFGSKDMNTITDFVVDRGMDEGCCVCSYTPNTDYLNLCIEKWVDSEIHFMGIFHTHFADVNTLSSADKDYIEQILNVMPEEISRLYFPVYTLPNRKITAYVAERFDNKILIYNEKVELI